MLYTRKGDNGTTKTFGCDQRISKGGDVAEALGALDEVNSFLGLVKVKSLELDKIDKTSSSKSLTILNVNFVEIVAGIQQNLFIIQAEVAGSKMSISEEKIIECEGYIDEAEKILPPIKTFFVSGGTEVAVLCDISRTLARKAERRVVAVKDGHGGINGDFNISEGSLAYLNRLSSLLYAMARLSNFYGGIVEDAPSYK